MLSRKDIKVGVYVGDINRPHRFWRVDNIINGTIYSSIFMAPDYIPKKVPYPDTIDEWLLINESYIVSPIKVTLLTGKRCDA